MSNIHRVLVGTLAIAISLLFTSCGAVTQMGGNTPAFVNQTKMQDADFQNLAGSTWQKAQTATATQWTDLWAAYRVLQNQPAAPGCYTGAISCAGFIPPVAEAASLAPKGIVVTAVA